MNSPRICILVLNWNGADDTLECLDSLQNLTYAHAEVVVIDNGSDDDSVAKIKQAFPHIFVLELSTNLFFGGGNNAGLKWADTQGFEYVIFLNNDTTVEPDFIEPLLASFDRSERVGMVAPMMCYASDPERVWYGGGSVNLWTGIIVHKHIRDQVSEVSPELVSTDYITGCCMMMPTKVATELAGFHPAFKMYGEDVDLSLRCRKAGYKLMFCPQSKIFHKVSASLGGEFGFSKFRRKLEGLFKVYSKHTRWYHWPTIIPSQLIFFFANIQIFKKIAKNSLKTAK